MILWYLYMISHLKSTFLPWLSVRKPSSNICSITFDTSLCAFSNSSNSTTCQTSDACQMHVRSDRRWRHLIRSPSDSFCQSSTFFVTDVTGRCTDQSGYRMSFHVFRHIYTHHSWWILYHPSVNLHWCFFIRWFLYGFGWDEFLLRILAPVQNLNFS